MKNIQRLSLLLIILLRLVSIYAQEQTVQYRCTFQSAPYNQITGLINISHQAPETTFTLALEDPQGLLGSGEDNYTIHVRQFGIDDLSESCDETGLHYNPILNYGEISPRLGEEGFLTSEKISSGNFTADWLEFDGENDIKGRSLTIETGDGEDMIIVGCCTIVVTPDLDQEPSQPWNGSLLMARGPDYIINFTFSEDLTNVNITYNISGDVSSPRNASIARDGECGEEFEVLFDQLPELNSTNGTELFPAEGEGAGAWVGRSIRVSGGEGGEETCAILTQQAAQENGEGNDFYLEGAETETETETETDTETDDTETVTLFTETMTETETETDTDTDTDTDTTEFTETTTVSSTGNTATLTTTRTEDTAGSLTDPETTDEDTTTGGSVKECVAMLMVISLVGLLL